jgi:predicted nucleic acid-binding protein
VLDRDAVIAEKDGSKLVTEDTELLKKCTCAIQTKDALEDT